LHERRCHTGIVDINYADCPPNGQPFVILHGGAGRWQSGAGLIRLLSNKWHVYAPDFRGHGKSGRVAGHYLLSDYAADTAAFLLHAVHDQAILYGHSLGGEVAIMVAAHYPEHVRAVIVGDAPMSAENHPTEEVAHQQMNVLWRTLAGRPSKEIVPALKEMLVPIPHEASKRASDASGDESPWFEFQALSLSQLDPDVLDAVLEGPNFMLAGYEPDKLLPAISCPVLLLQADAAAGGMMRNSEVELALRLLRQPTHVRLPEIGHELHAGSGGARRVFDAIAPFLTSLT
jgi:pimeloyl-ACP methyl ester carboxylesterase